MKINPKDRCKHQYEVIESWHSESEDPNFLGSLNFKVRCTKCGEERIFTGCIFMGCGNELEDNDVVKVESFEYSSPSEDYTEINRWLAKEHICRSCEVNKGVTYLSSIGWFCGDCLREFLPATVGDWMFLLGEHFPTKKLYEVKREAKILKRKSPNIILGSFQKYTGEDIIVMLKGE